MLPEVARSLFSKLQQQSSGAFWAPSRLHKPSSRARVHENDQNVQQRPPSTVSEHRDAISGNFCFQVRFLRIVWFYRGSRGFFLDFKKRVRQTRFRRRSRVGDRENAFSASPPSTRTRGRPPSARASTNPSARAIFTARARELDCVRARFGPARASMIAIRLPTREI